MARQCAFDAGCEILFDTRNLSGLLGYKVHESDVQRVLPTDLQKTISQPYRPVLIKLMVCDFEISIPKTAMTSGPYWIDMKSFSERNRARWMTSWKLKRPVSDSQLDFYPLYRTCISLAFLLPRLLMCHLLQLQRPRVEMAESGFYPVRSDAYKTVVFWTPKPTVSEL